MAAKTKVELKGSKAVLKKLKKAGKFFGGDLKISNEIGLFQLTQIKRRNSTGHSLSGGFFKGYDPGYKAWKASKGHPVNRVTLFLTGQMTNSMTYNAAKDKVTLKFANTENADKARKNNVKFPFWGINKTDEKGITRIFKAGLQRALSG